MNFTQNGLDTIQPIEEPYNLQGRPRMGHKSRLNKGDITQTNLLYKCPGKFLFAIVRLVVSGCWCDDVMNSRKEYNKSWTRTNRLYNEIIREESNFSIFKNENTNVGICCSIIRTIPLWRNFRQNSIRSSHLQLYDYMKFTQTFHYSTIFFSSFQMWSLSYFKVV